MSNKKHGKKYNAAEKHFLEKEGKYVKTVKELNAELTKIMTAYRELSVQYDHLKREYTALKLMHEKLRQYSRLSDDDLKTAIEKDKTIAGFLPSIMSMLSETGHEDT